MQEYDALIVGARVAGATVAASLGDAGYRVLLVDRASFPSPALSTHYFRGAGFVSVLQDLGVLPGVLVLDAPPLTAVYRYANGDSACVVNPPQEPGDIGFSLSVRRVTMDYLLAQRAQASPSVQLLQQTQVTGLAWEDGRVVGARLKNRTGEQEVRTRIVIGADGRHSSIARAVRAADEFRDAPTRALYYCYVRGFAPPAGAAGDGPEFSLLEDELAYVFPSDQGFTCLALSIGLPEYNSFPRTRDGRAARLGELLDRHRGIAPRWRAATPDGGWLGAAPEPNFVRMPVGPGWALVGDAGLHQDPWTGFGMDMAGVHARSLARALVNWWQGSAGEEEALAAYRRERDEHGLGRYQQSVQYGADLRQLVAG